MTKKIRDSEIEPIDIYKEIRYYLFFWPWILACTLLMGICSFLYLRYSQTIYETSATLQVKETGSDPSSFLTLSTSSMFNFNSVNIDNNITQTSSKPNLRNVVKALDLQTAVFKLGRIKDDLKFGQQMANTLIRGQVTVIESAGHMLPAEFPGEVNTALRNFLNETDKS